MVFIIMAGLFSLYDNPEKDKIEEVGIGQVIEKINNEEVAEITVKGDELEILLRNGQQLKTFKESTESLSTLLDNYNVPTEKSGQINIKVQGKSGFEYWLSGLLPFLIPLFFILGFIFYICNTYC